MSAKEQQKQIFADYFCTYKESILIYLSMRELNTKYYCIQQLDMCYASEKNKRSVCNLKR